MVDVIEWKPVDEEDDYLKKMENARDNIVDFLNARQIIPTSTIG